MLAHVEKERISLAINTSDVAILMELMYDKLSAVRRAVARNTFATRDILDALIYDPVLNVSYMASQNKNCTTKRSFNNDLDHPCVCCKAYENTMNCDNCPKLKKYRQ